MVNGTPLDGDSGSEKSGGGYSHAFRLALPPDPLILGESIRLISDQNLRREDLAQTLVQDPVLTLELIKEANASNRERASMAVATVQTALTRLGTVKCYQLLQHIGQRPLLQSQEQGKYLETVRSRGKRIGLISRMMATVLSRQLANEIHVAGVLVCIGEMLAVLHLGDSCVRASQEAQSRAGFLYKLDHDLKFDTEKVTATYLSLHGIPDSLLVAFDKEALARHKDRGIVRTIVAAASEMVDFFDANRWEKLAPGKELPSKSNLRLLQFSDPSQYRKLYERSSEYLFSVRNVEVAQRAAAAKALATTAWESAEIIEATHRTPSTPSLVNETHTFPPSSEEPIDDSSKNPTETENLLYPEGEAPGSNAEQDRAILFEKFDLDQASKSRRTPRAPVAQPTSVLPQLKLSGAQKTVSAMVEELKEANTSQDLLRTLLSILVDQGPFEKTALIVVSRDRKDALVVASRGPIANSGKRFSIEDPLSPLALCLSRVQSFGATDSEISPFGSKSFALAPIDADHDTPVALYADCGNSGTITFEARRIFRTVVELVNLKLKEVSGGIPIEFNV